MSELVLTIAKINLLVVLLFAAYRCVRNWISFYQCRILLVTIPILSTLAVLIQPAISNTVSIATINLPVIIETSQIQVQPTFNLISILFGIILMISIISLVKFILSTVKVYKFFKPLKYEIIEENIKCYKTSIYDSFSFFNKIHINNEIPPEDQEIVIEHECLHVFKRHSHEIMFITLIKSIFWFNPIFLALISELKQVHEYEIDAELYHKYKSEYLNFLVSFTLGASFFETDLSHSFLNNVTLSKRIKTMKKRKRKSTVLFSTIPLLALLFMLTASSGILNPLPQKSYVTIDEEIRKPQFKGGQEALMAYMIENIKYPKDAYEVKTEGTVIVQFVVKADGAVSDVKVNKGVDESLDKEAVRVVSNMPDWIPARKGDKNVAVQLQLPIKFKI